MSHLDPLAQQLQTIVDTINQNFEVKNAVRDRTLNRSRELIRSCANSIRATQRGDDTEARRLLDIARQTAVSMQAEARQYPDVYFAGYTQDALKEMAEAYLTRSIILEETIPTPEELDVDYPAYLNGLAEAAGELRRFALDALRRGHVAQSDRILGHMDDIYSLLVTVDFSSAITGGLRRNTDMVRGVLERTRGDVTTAMRQESMKAALTEFEQRMGIASQVEYPAWQEDNDEGDEQPARAE